MKDNKQTFAARALEIQKKYKRAKFDPVEKRDMEAELDALIDEQEAYKASKGMGQPQQQFGDGGKPDNWLNTLKTPDYFGTIINGLATAPKNGALPNSVPVGGIKPIGATGSSKQGLVITPGMKNSMANSAAHNYSPRTGEESTSFLPTAIGAGANMLGNLFLANQAKKLYNPVSPTMASVDKINLEPQAEQMRRDAAVSKRTNMLNARNLGTNAGETLANVSAGNTGVDRGLGANLTNLYMNQEQFNVGASNQASMFNAQNKSRSDMFNSQSKTNATGESLDYLSGALSVPGNAMREVQTIKADEKNKRLLENYYKSIGGQHYEMMNSLYGINPFQTNVR